MSRLACIALGEAASGVLAASAPRVIHGSAWSADGPRVKKNNRAGERDTLSGDAYARQFVR
jgi:hypothetical protein